MPLTIDQEDSQLPRKHYEPILCDRLPHLSLPIMLVADLQLYDKILGQLTDMFFS
jgi:hypothetical protein